MPAENIAEFNKILTDLKSRKFAPVYYFYGEEHYFIDELSNIIENTVLNEGEKGFNQTVFYGKDADVANIVNSARRFPMMAPFQVIIVKEAQGMKGLDEFEGYFEKPVPSTILVICNKSGKLDKRTRFYKALTKHVIYESKKMYDNELPAWVEKYLKGRGFGISQRAATLIADSLGSDLGKIVNELEKLIINKDNDKEITDTDVELKIGISREFNVFELMGAVATKNAGRALHIAHHMGKSKEFSIIGTLINMNSFFNKTYIVKQSNIKDRNQLQRQLGLNYFQATDCLNASARYSVEELERCIRIVHEYDLKSKGFNNASASPDELLKEVLVKIL